MTSGVEFGLVGGTSVKRDVTPLGNERHAPRSSMQEQLPSARLDTPRVVGNRAVEGPVFGATDEISVVSEWHKYWKETGEIIEED